LSPNQQGDVMAFIDRYQAESIGALRISAPGSGRDKVRASNTIRQIKEMAMEAGVSPQSIRVERQPAYEGHAGSVRLVYPRREVVPPECGDWSEDLGRDHARVYYPNFGCATQRNLALNVANPRDLQRPQPETPSSSERRYVNWTKYVGAPAAASGSSADSAKQAPPKGQNAGATGTKQ
jgi:pilus assembly protein CpaD